MLSSDGDEPMTTTTDLSKKQLATILSALDDTPRNPANRGEGLRAIGCSAISDCGTDQTAADDYAVVVRHYWENGRPERSGFCHNCGCPSIARQYPLIAAQLS